MAQSLWVGQLRAGPAAARPTVPDFAADTIGFYYATDTGALSFGVSGGAWSDFSANMGNAILANLPTVDPEEDGALWNDGGVLAVSAGA